MDISQRRESTALVRAYSWETEQRIPETSPGYVLSQTLIRERGNLERLADPWRALLGPSELMTAENPITDVIATESHKLRNIWQNHSANSKLADHLDPHNTDPTVEGVTKLVNDGLASWNDKRKEGRWGKVKEWFHGFCGTIDAHRSLLKMLPESSEYVSIFSGSITAIVQASVNHEGIAEDVAQALCEISENIQECALDLSLYETEEMQKRVAQLYLSIFRFLVNASEWVLKKKRKRFRDSFNENLRRELGDQISDIKAKSQKIRDQAAQWGRVEGRVARLALDEVSKAMPVLGQDVSNGFGSIRSRLTQLEQAMAIDRKVLARDLIECLREMGLTFLNETRQNRISAVPQRGSLISSASSFITTTRSIDDTTDVESAPNFLSSRSTRLEQFYRSDRIRLAATGFEASLIPPVMIMRLSEWLHDETTKSSLLWLQAERPDLQEDHENLMSMLAATFTELTAKIELPDKLPMPLVSYFCPNGYHEILRDGNPTAEAQGTISLVYALLRQIVYLQFSLQEAQSISQLFLERLDTNLSQLDGSLKTWRQAMNLFEEVLPLIPRGTLCVIDGVHWLDGRHAEPYLVELIKTLRWSKMKLLLTTSARSGALLQEIKPGETVQIEDADDMDRY